MKDLFDLQEKVVIVIGGTGYLGLSICEGLAQYGATLIITSRNGERCKYLSQELADRYGVKAIGTTVDVLNTQSVQHLYRSANEQFGKIDVLINNAVVSTPGFIEDLNDDIWKLGMDGTINMVFRCVREVLPYMIQKKYGKIINIASMYGVIAPNPSVYNGDPNLNNPANYGAGKAAIIQFTKYIASYYGKFGILSNCISPGSFPHAATQKNTEFMGKLAEKTMLGRIGFPDELKGTVILLASDASNYITGQNICVDGGVTSW